MPKPHKPSRDNVQLIVHRPALGAFLFAWHHDVRYLQRWRLTRQRKHLVHGDSGSDRCIAQARFANLLCMRSAPIVATSARRETKCFFRSAMLFASRFRREHVLVVVCVEIAPDHNAFYGWHRRA